MTALDINARAQMWGILFDNVQREARFAHSQLHGDTHWRSVAAAGLIISDLHVEVSPSIVLAFAMLHDSQRQNDETDEAHGARAGAVARRIEGLEALLPSGGRETVAQACDGHELGGTSENPHIGACWDADRFNLWRVDVRPHPKFFSVFKLEPHFSGLSHHIRDTWHAPPTWPELINLAISQEERLHTATKGNGT